MTGSDLIVLAPWLVFGVALAVICVQLFRSRRESRRHQRPSPGPAGAASRPGRAGAAQEPADRSKPQEARCRETKA
jgi:hypothetical protein